LSKFKEKEFNNQEMTDKTVETTPQETPEDKGMPTPAFSAASEGATSDGKAVDVEARLESFRREILEEAERRSQSVKDKRIGKLEESIANLSKAKELLSAHGGDVQKAAREKLLIEAAEAIGVPEPQKPSPRPIPGRDEMVQEYDAEITDYLMGRGFKPEDIREATAGMATKTFKTVKEAFTAAAAMADTWRENRVKQNAPANAGGMVVPKGGAVSRDLTEQYIKDFSAAYGNPAQARAVREKYKNLGVDVGSIGWGARGVREKQGD